MNKNPRCRMVAVPRELMPQLEKELDEKGYFSYPQLMHDIITHYFGCEGAKAKSASKTIFKEVKKQ